MSRPRPSTALLVHNPAATAETRTQPNTGTGQIRRTTSGATEIISTTTSAGCSRMPSRDSAGMLVTRASKASSTSDTQRPAARAAGYPAGRSALMPIIVPGQASARRSRQAAAPIRTTA
jgi:hypothetical protein